MSSYATVPTICIAIAKREASKVCEKMERMLLSRVSVQSRGITSIEIYQVKQADVESELLV